jgi:hypothetical protein
MNTATATPEQVARLCVRQVLEALRAAGRAHLRHTETVGGYRLTIGAIRTDEPDSADELADLPEVLHGARPSWCTVYRIVRDLRAAEPGRELCARHVHAEFEARTDEFVSTSTVYQALMGLRRLRVLVKAPLVRWTTT